MIARYFRRLWCAIAHQGRWETDFFGTNRCRICGEIHNEETQGWRGF
jgi:hypothetical protein